MKLPVLTFVALLLFTSIAYADKLAPPPNTLQPLPVNVQPAVSQNVQRTATPEDLQSVQQAQVSEPAPDSNVAPTVTSQSVDLSTGSFSGTEILVIILLVLVLLGGAVAWLWRSF
jgi:hypothetical protein